ncbi:MAG: HNH endonuclease signature motif containing protein [Planktothrix sp. GU0601_MAG3]|nr:MAG: HNH endonuclease signature motif containing protein [Planktothrix sp. GU0601_MAG3]
MKQLDEAGDFTPTNREETRKRISRWIAQRRGQPKFRKELLEAYNYRCAITGCNAEEALEAAHIIPYCETEDNAIYNGLLLRADIHTLFDLNLIAIAPGDNYPEDVENLTIQVAPSLRQTSYGELHNNPIKHVPNNKSDLPDKDSLLSRCQQCSWFI